jgi:hypothetical protein
MGMASMGNMGAAGGMGGKWTSYNVQFLTWITGSTNKNALSSLKRDCFIRQHCHIFAKLFWKTPIPSCIISTAPFKVMARFLSVYISVPNYSWIMILYFFSLQVWEWNVSTVSFSLKEINCSETKVIPVLK